MDEHVFERWLAWFTRAFLAGLIVWVVAAAVLGIPHGPGHSIESLTPVQTIHDISFPVWIGSLAGIAGLLAVRAFQSLDGPGPRAS
jgi:hypothetical protein